MKLIISILSISLICFACSSKQNAIVEQTVEPKPNIILIAADDLGWSDIGAYGSEIHTPNLDRLANEGMRFTQFHNTSKCFPSRATLITGVYAQDNGYSETFTNPITNAVTIGEVLQKSGYLTYWSGKHHGLENPYTRGFNHYYGLKDGACNYFSPGPAKEGQPKPAQKRKIRYWANDAEMTTEFTPEEVDFYTTDYFTNYALTYMEEAHQEKKPFFLYLAYNAPHDPLMAWPEDIAKYEENYTEGYETIRKARYKKQMDLGLIDDSFALSESTYRDWDKLTKEQQEVETRKMQVYAAMIDRMDQNIGRVLDQLEQSGQLENSIIFFVSDNGASPELVQLDDDNDEAVIGGIERWVSLGPDWANVSNTPFRYFKNDSYEGGINTPLIAWWPKKIKANTFSNFSSHFVDIMSTIVDITDATYPEKFNGQDITPMRGVSLLPVLEGNLTKRENPLFWQWLDGKAVAYNNWKIVKRSEEKPWDLYNLENDPTETTNLSEQYPDKVSELNLLFENWISSYTK